MADTSSPQSQRALRIEMARWRRAGLVLCFASILLIYWSVTHLELVPVRTLQHVSPRAISGDEPHYLIILNSILFDHDLQLQDDYARVSRGGLEAGAGYAGTNLDHPTILVNRRTGYHASALIYRPGIRGQEPGVWLSTGSGFRVFLPGNSFARRNDPELAPGPDVFEVPAHPVAFPALLALLIAPLRPALADVERDASLAMVLIAWAGVVVTFLIGRKVGMTQGAALGAALLLGLGSPWFAYARSYYSEPAIGLALALALYAIEADRLVPAALAVGAALWLKAPFVLVGAGFVLELLWERRFRDAILMSLVVGACGLALVSFNYWLARTFVIPDFGVPLATDFHSLYDTLLLPGHGLFIFAPWTALALFPLGHALCSEPSHSSLLRRMALPIALYLVLLVIVDYDPGYSYGPRYWVPFMPWLAIAAVETMRSSSLGRRIIYSPLLLAGVAIAIPAALCYPNTHPFIYSLPPSAAWRALF